MLIYGNRVNLSDIEIESLSTTDTKDYKSIRLFPTKAIEIEWRDIDIRDWVKENLAELLSEANIDTEGFVNTSCGISRSLNHGLLKHHIDICFNKIANIGNAKVLEKDGCFLVTDKPFTEQEFNEWIGTAILYGYGVYSWKQSQREDNLWVTSWWQGSTCD